LGSHPDGYRAGPDRALLELQDRLEAELNDNFVGRSARGIAISVHIGTDRSLISFGVRSALDLQPDRYERQ